MNKLSSLVAFLGTLLVAIPAFAEDGAAASSNYGWYAIAAALVLGMGALGGTLGQGRAAAAALEGIARNPSAAGKVFTPFILGLALIESLVIFAFVVAFLVLGKIA
ncbi:MAG: ATP synthase F0 subunit C [Myxococcota bacterium]